MPRALQTAVSMLLLGLPCVARSEWPASFRAEFRRQCLAGFKTSDLGGGIAERMCDCIRARSEASHPDTNQILGEDPEKMLREITLKCVADVQVTRQKAANGGPGGIGWSKSYRATVFEGCTAAAGKASGLPGQLMTPYCRCTARELEKRFPDPDVADRYGYRSLAGLSTPFDAKTTAEVAGLCAAEAAEPEAQAWLAVEGQIMRHMRKGATRANAARQVLVGFAGYNAMLKEMARPSASRPESSIPLHDRLVLLEAERAYGEACTACAAESECSKDRLDILVNDSAEKPSPCGAARAPGEVSPPPISELEREALAADAAPYLAAMTRGYLMGLFEARRSGRVVQAKDIVEAEVAYVDTCSRVIERLRCERDRDLIRIGRAEKKLPWSGEAASR